MRHPKTLTPTLSRKRERGPGIVPSSAIGRRGRALLPLPLAGEGGGRSGAFEPHAASPLSGPGLQAGTRTASEGRRTTTGLVSPRTPGAARRRPWRALKAGRRFQGAAEPFRGASNSARAGIRGHPQKRVFAPRAGALRFGSNALRPGGAPLNCSPSRRSPCAAGRRPGTGRSHNPRRGAGCGRRGSRCGCAPPPGRSAARRQAVR